MKLMPLQPEDLAEYKLDMQEAFQMGAVADTWTKHYRGMDMPHLKYAVHR